jgi:hypothetical protein
MAARRHAQSPPQQHQLGADPRTQPDHQAGRSGTSGNANGRTRRYETGSNFTRDANMLHPGCTLQAGDGGPAPTHLPCRLQVPAQSPWPRRGSTDSPLVRELCQPRREADVEAHHGEQLESFASPREYPPIWTVISARLSSHATAHKWMICSLITRRGGLGCSLVQTVMDGSPSLAKKKGRDTSCHQHPALHTSSWRFGGPSNNIRGGQAEPVASR